MNTQINPHHLTAWRLFITAQARILDQIDRELQAASCVPLHWYDALIELQEAPDKRLRMSELARKVVLSKSGLTRLVDKLEAAGLLLRQSSAEDGRGAYVTLTDDGYAALRTAWPVYARGIQRYFADSLSPDDADVFQAALTRMLQQFEDPR